MLDPGLKELEVMDYTEALQMTQGMEARGDFQFKGIHKMFLLVSEWTEKFSTNQILPEPKQVMREVAIDKAKFDLFFHELCVKIRPPILKKVSLLEFNPNGTGPFEYIDGYVRHLTVLVRPGTKDQNSAYRYIEVTNEMSVKAIVRYFKEIQKSNISEHYKDDIIGKIVENKLGETYVSSQIGNLFDNPYDKDSELKNETLRLHLKPVLKKLVEDKHLYFFRNEKALKPVNKSVFLYNDKNFILTRIEAYKTYLRKKIIPDLQRIGVIGQVSEQDFADIRRITSMVIPFMNESYGDGKSMVEELIILTDFYEKGKLEEEKKQQKDKIEEIVSFLKESGKIVDIKNIRIKGEPLSEEIVSVLKGNEKIKYAEFADKKDVTEVVLHKENISSAMDFARKLFKTTKNDRDIQILRLMDIANVDPKIKEAFEKLEAESFFEYLPFLAWLWRAIFGNTSVHKFEADEIRSRLDANQKELIIKHKSKQVEKEKAKLVQERLKEKKETELNSGSNSVDFDSGSPEERKGVNQSEQMEKENEEKETVEKIVNILDNAWNQNKFPDREYLLFELGGSVQEENLIMFLKKHASKNIFSYQIRNPQEKYRWPILISRGYLKKNGEKLLAKAKKEVDKQKSEMMPNQEQFDLASSLEDFLVRILPKIAK